MVRARGDSMDEGGINNGDFVLVRQQSSAENGDTVVDAALLCRILHRVRAGTTLVLGDDAQQDPRGGRHGGCAHGHRPDVRRSPGTPAVAVVADARGLCL